MNYEGGLEKGPPCAGAKDLSKAAETIGIALRWGASRSSWALTLHTLRCSGAGSLRMRIEYFDAAGRIIDYCI
jgi:hypothetical protein